MTLVEYRDLVHDLPFGKRLPGAVYIHSSLLAELPESLRLLVEKLMGKMALPEEFNVIKFHRTQLKVSILCYPDFF